MNTLKGPYPIGLLGLISALKIGPMCLLEIFNCFSVNHQSNIANEKSRRFRGSRPHPPIIKLYSWLVLKRNQSKNRVPHWIGQHPQPSRYIYIKTAAQHKLGWGVYMAYKNTYVNGRPRVINLHFERFDPHVCNIVFWLSSIRLRPSY